MINSKYAWPTIKKYGFKIEDTGFMYLIKTPTNTKIQWFHNTGMMIIEHNATSDQKTMGLCGKLTLVFCYILLYTFTVYTHPLSTHTFVKGNIIFFVYKLYCNMIEE